ncbi:carotenoid biosynthesis protein [Pontibacillus yanchengensis]|uniref:carotenoid biosynthesis protein n=1 Tax=Pontibacillus yanchengensis TaxID=462910 RepID=UPI001371B3AA
MSVWLFRFYLIWFGCGFVLLSFDILPPALQWANAVFLTLAGLLGGIYFLKQYGPKKGITYSLFVIIMSISIEHIGVQYQWWFGHYHYTQDFGPMIGGVPFAIGFAWLMVMAGAHEISRTLLHRLSNLVYLLLFIIVGGLLAVSIDLILDPVAFHVKNYWVWTKGSFYYDIPFTNFSGWFILAAFFQLLAHIWFYKDPPKDMIWRTRVIVVYSSTQILFIWLAFLGGLYGAALLVTSLMLLWGLVYIKMRHDS